MVVLKYIRFGDVLEDSHRLRGSFGYYNVIGEKSKRKAKEGSNATLTSQLKWTVEIMFGWIIVLSQMLGFYPPKVSHSLVVRLVGCRCRCLLEDDQKI